MVIIKDAANFGFNECGDITVRLDCYEREMLRRALKFYKFLAAAEAEEIKESLQLAAGFTEDDIVGNSPELAGAEEWAARAAQFEKDAILVNSNNY